MNRLGLAIFFLALILVGRLGYMQLVRGDYYSLRAQQNSTRYLVIDAARGDIVTSDDALLVTSRPAYVVSWLVPSDAGERQRVIELLVKMLEEYGVTAERIETLVQENVWRRYQPIRLAVDVSEETVLAIDERRMELPGVMVERQAVRDYPFGDMACYLIGGLGAITQNKLPEYRNAGYRMDATVGVFGLENAYELVNPDISLRGVDGYRQVEVDHSNRLIADLGETPAIKGNQMTLTIDSRLQAAAEQALAETITRLNDKDSRYPDKPSKGAAVVLDVHTGAVLAWASYPPFDQGNWAGADFLWTSNVPLYAYPVGSTFKPITLMAGLAAGVVDPDETFYCPGYYSVGATKKYCWQRSGHGHLNLTEGLKVSCNVVFYTIAQRLVNEFGRDGGMDQIGAIAQLFQMDQELPIDFAPGYLRASGIIPTSENFKRIYKYTPYPGEVWSTAIGQGIVEFTPLQMASYAAMIANGGYRYQPYVVQKISSPDGEVTFQAEPNLLNQVSLDSEALEIVRAGMHEVMLPANRPGGPGYGSAYYRFTVDPILRDGQKVELAGKTGTAEVAGVTPHSWFISYGPYEEPEIAMAIFVEHGRSGAAGAVPIAHAIYKAYFEQATASPTLP
jgi:penicillin-binding protein 2